MKTNWVLALGCIFVALTLTACKKDSKQVRLEWNLRTLVKPYQSAGFTNRKWDASAKLALSEFARSRVGVQNTNEPWSVIIATNAAAAVQSGCTDPLVNYLYVKFALDSTNTPETFSDDFCKVASDMESSSYPNIRKFYAAAAAMDQIYFAYGTNAPTLPVTRDMLNILGLELQATMADKTMPPEEAYEVAERALYLMSGGQKQYEVTYDCVAGQMFTNWPHSSLSWLLKGEGYVQKAWFARGSGTADTVTPEGWDLFFKDLAIADDALTTAWNTNSNDIRIPIAMMNVCLGLGNQTNRDEMELWFNRGMKIDPNNYKICNAKLYYLWPRWYGSREDMVEFGRECVASTNWGGNVPLILTDAHLQYWQSLEDSEEKSNYWQRPDVWPDIASAFDRFFELNPNATNYYHNYAWFAYHCQQWDTLNELIPQLGPVNYAYFGGQAEYDRMVQLAKQNARTTRSQ